MRDDPADRTYEQWQLEGDAAELYQRYLVPAITAGWAADLVERAGLRVRIVTETRIARFASVSDYVRIQLTATPLASLLTHQAEGSIRQLAAALITDVAAALQARRTDGGLAFPQEAHILMAST